MREKKIKLNFKKIKIASMSFLKGGVLTNTCESYGLPYCPQVPASAPGNACTDACTVGFISTPDCVVLDDDTTNSSIITLCER